MEEKGWVGEHAISSNGPISALEKYAISKSFCVRMKQGFQLLCEISAIRTVFIFSKASRSLFSA